MKITTLGVEEHGILRVESEDGRTGLFDVRPYMNSDVFRALRDETAFRQVSNGSYYIEWSCGADLSADTIEARWRLTEGVADAVRAVAESPPPTARSTASSTNSTP